MASKHLRERRYGEAAPLMEAAFTGHAEVARVLIRAGASVNAASKFGNTALTRAANRGFVDAVELLLKNGADVRARNKYGNNQEYSFRSPVDNRGNKWYCYEQC